MAKVSSTTPGDSQGQTARQACDTPNVDLDSRVSFSTCNSVRIHRSNPTDEIAHGRDDSEEFAIHDYTGSPSNPDPQARLAEAASAVHYALLNFQEAEKIARADHEVRWTTSQRQDMEGPESAALHGPESSEPKLEGSSLQPERHRRRPFHKWVQTLSRRRTERRHLRRLDNSDQTQTSEISDTAIGCSVSRRHSSSISSFAYVSGVRDASISGAGTSVVASSRKQRLRSSKRLSKTDRSSHASYSVRYSEDERPQSQVDPLILERSRHRRRILEELIETEEGYIGDIKFLTKSYLTIFALHSSADSGLRKSMHKSMTDIVELHDQLLGELHAAVFKSEYAGVPPVGYAYHPQSQEQQKPRGLDVVLENKTKGLPLYGYSGLAASSQTAAAVACIFAKYMEHFSIYQEYGAKYRLVIDDLRKINSSNSRWNHHQKGLEVMASYLSYTRSAGNTRALSIEDLLAKPIQRACRYPLLFKELLKATPVYDCPRSHSTIENVYSELENVAKAMNRATDDPHFESTLQKTWLLQKRLRFPPKGLNRISKNIIRSFGHIELCGILYVCWQTKSSVEGSYMIGLLYHHWLCLAMAEKTGKIYTLQACIPLDNCLLEEAHNKRGLQCHSAPFTWKVVFECDSQLYELLMTTGTQAEQREWMQRLKSDWREANRGQHGLDDSLFEFLALKIKSLGQFSKPGMSDGRPAMRRATTEIQLKSPIYQVILKNTRVGREPPQESYKYAAINRSRSLQTDSRTSILAPSRGDRTSLESQISDVWTYDILFCTGTDGHRGWHHKRPSASSIMRKISVTNLTSTFGRRSISRSASHKTVDRVDHKSPGQATVQPLLPEVDLAIKASLSHVLSRYHDKASHIDVTVRERDSTDASNSLEKERDQLYTLSGPTEPIGDLHGQESKHSKPAPAASAPRYYSATRFIEGFGYLRPNRSKETTHSSQSQELPIQTSPTPGICQMDGSTPSAVQLAMSNSAVQTKAPLTPQSGPSAPVRHGRHWLGRPLLHRRSFHRSHKVEPS